MRDLTATLQRSPLKRAEHAVGSAADSLRHVSLHPLVSWNAVALGLLRDAVIVLLAFAAYRMVKLFTRRLVRHQSEAHDPIVKRLHEQRAQTIASLLNNVALVTIAIITALLLLASIMDIGPLLATAGIAGLAISFGAQSLVKDIIGGMIIVLEAQFGIGDVIRVAGTSGQVEKITLRATTLRDLQGVVHTVPNGQINTVSNMTKGWSRAVLDIGVAYKEDVDRVMDVLRDIGREMRADPEWSALMMEDIEIAGVDDFGDSAVVIRVLAKTLPLKQWSVGREMRRRIKIRFDREGIEIPFPHRTLYWGVGQPPPSPADTGGTEPTTQS